MGPRGSWVGDFQRWCVPGYAARKELPSTRMATDARNEILQLMLWHAQSESFRERVRPRTAEPPA